MKDECRPIEHCIDCQDLGFRSIAHKCHCHYKENELPNLGELVDQTITGVFYVKSQETKKVVGLKIITDQGELLIKTKEVKYARRL